MLNGEIKRFVLVVPETLGEEHNDAVYRGVINNLNNTGFTAELVAPDEDLRRKVEELSEPNREVSIIATGQGGFRAMEAAMATSRVSRIIAIATPFYTYPERRRIEEFLQRSGMPVLTMQPNRNDPILLPGQGSLRGSHHVEYPFRRPTQNPFTERVVRAFQLHQTIRRFLMAPQRVKN